MKIIFLKNTKDPRKNRKGREFRKGMEITATDEFCKKFLKNGSAEIKGVKKEPPILDTKAAQELS